MLNASKRNDVRSNVAGSGVRETSREFPSFRLMDTVNPSTVSRGTGAFAPLRFTLDASMRSNQQQPRPRLVRPTLISPPGRQEDGTTLTTKQTHDAPLFPSMEEFKAQASATKSLKRPASEMPPISFLPYKKRAIASIVSKDLDEDSSRRSPAYLQQLAENEPRMKEAASILLDMRALAAAKENTDLPSMPRSVSQGSDFTSVETTETTPPTLAEAPVNPPAADQPKAAAGTTRTVTPAPPAPSGVRLAFPEDKHELNSLHCFVRAELLEVFALPGADEDSTSTQGGKPTRTSRRNGTSTATSGRSYSSGRVGLRCVYCAHLPRRVRTGSTMSSFYPKSLNDIYRSVCTWQRIHFKTCRHIPPQVRQGYWQLKESDRTRGKTRYWVSSAQRLGLVDIDSERGGICFATAPTQS